ncbi:MAG: ATP-binding protein [Rhizobacter sp.]|nr:ATP-binding protein [Rhizobacter sp.]
MPKPNRWGWIVTLVALSGAAMVLFFLLSISTGNRVEYERQFEWLFWGNVVVAALLTLAITVAVARLLLRVRGGKFGSRMLLRLAVTFAFVGVVPGVLIYTVSYQFVARSIESWFDVKVEGALDAGLALGRATLEGQVKELGVKTLAAAERLGDAGPVLPPLALERLREQLAASDVAIVDASGQVTLSAGGTDSALVPRRPDPTLLREARSSRVASRLQGLESDAGVPTPNATRARALALIPSNNFALDAQDRFLMVTQAVPPNLAANALAVQAAYSEYQQRALAREGLKRMYIGTLTLALILSVFGALLLAVAIGNQVAQPLLMLADGVRQVASGDLTPKPVFASRDELGGLTRAFADMTGQLHDARALVQRSVAQLESARANLQTILDNLTAGVIVFDRDGRIDTVNPGATRILRLPLSAYRGRRLAEVAGLEAFADEVMHRFEAQDESREPGERSQWQDAFELQTAPERDKLTLLVRGAAMPQDARLMVFDDITEVVSAQRAEAWSEVARRLAHEIKNPLTPIQLSAERIAHRLGPKLESADQAMLARSVETIVNQVQSMKTLVNEFRDYARLPAAQLLPLDLNALVGEVLALYATEQESGRLRAECEAGLPMIVGDTTQLRQVVHNLVQNALDAVADRADGVARVRTETSRDERGHLRAVRLLVIDNGPGFADKVLKRAFEPYVTTKSKGTGLGLAVVKKIADEHGARLRVANLGAGPLGAADAAAGEGAPRGAQVSLSFSNFPPVDRPAAPAAVAASAT